MRQAHVASVAMDDRYLLAWPVLSRRTRRPVRRAAPRLALVERAGLARRRKTGQALALGSRIVLASAEGGDNRQIAERAWRREEPEATFSQRAPLRRCG